MKIPKILAVAAIFTTIFSYTVLAVPRSFNDKDSDRDSSPLHRKIEQNNEIGEKHFMFRKDNSKNRDFKDFDPIKLLEKRKEKINQLVREGKITQENANKITAKIDARIKEIEEFNRLSPEQKKEKLTEKYREFIDKKVRSGHLSQEKANELLEKFKEKIQKWDGKGYPFFMYRRFSKPLKKRTALKDELL